MKTLKTIANIALAFGVMLIFNESNTFWPNLIGIACLAALVWLNSDREKATIK